MSKFYFDFLSFNRIFRYVVTFLIAFCLLFSASVIQAQSPEETRPYLELPFPGKTQYRVSCGYGCYQHTRSMFYAVDLAIPEGVPIMAAAPGEVMAVTWEVGLPLNQNLGDALIVYLDHGHGWFTRYVHLDGITVRVGDQVDMGDVIGYGGKTGAAGDHLHFELKYGSSLYSPSVPINELFEGQDPERGKSYVSNNWTVENRALANAAKAAQAAAALAPTPTSAPTPTAVPPSATPTVTPSATPTVTPSATATVTPSATASQVPPSATASQVPPSATASQVPPSATASEVPPSATLTQVAASATLTLVPPTATPTASVVPSPTAQVEEASQEIVLWPKPQIEYKAPTVTPLVTQKAQPSPKVVSTPTNGRISSPACSSGEGEPCATPKAEPSPKVVSTPTTNGRAYASPACSQGALGEPCATQKAQPSSKMVSTPTTNGRTGASRSIPACSERALGEPCAALSETIQPKPAQEKLESSSPEVITSPVAEIKAEIKEEFHRFLPRVESGLSLSAESITVGQPITATFTLRNATQERLHLTMLGVGGRAEGQIMPLENTLFFDHLIVLNPGGTYEFSKSHLINQAGEVELFIFALGPQNEWIPLDGSNQTAPLRVEAAQSTLFLPLISNQE
ncbi:MAG: peptidoglycan DD-metalloendopeptidase family protein [Ardenticatenaceae bacterium]